MSENEKVRRVRAVRRQGRHVQKRSVVSLLVESIRGRERERKRGIESARHWSLNLRVRRRLLVEESEGERETQKGGNRKEKV